MIAARGLEPAVEGESDPAPAPGALPKIARGAREAGLVVLSWAYGIGARLHRASARWGWRKPVELSCAVVSVGGLTVGGAGKTPLAAALARGLQARGRRVVLASRGYRGNARDPVTVVSDGTRVRSSVAVAGDEALVLAAHAPGVPVLVGADRSVVGQRAVAAFDAEIVILDDGFQHHRLARDLDIVCIDGRAELGSRHVLPRGPLRESIGALKWADWIALIDAPAGALWPEGSRRPRAARRAEIVRATRRPTRLTALDRSRERPLTALSGRRVGLLCGVARPASLRHTLEGLGADVVAERVFPDHHAYRETDFASLPGDVDEWITTEKDAYKILPKWVAGAEVWVLGIELSIEGEKQVLDRLESRLQVNTRRAMSS